MTPERVIERLLGAYGPDGDPAEAVVAADYLLERGEARLAAAALDRAWGLAPRDPPVAAQRRAVLDGLAVVERGIRFRYVPAGTFLQGSATGDPDERPVHPVTLGGYWMSDAPVTWAQFCDLLGWYPPPRGFPHEVPDEPSHAGFHLRQANKIRLQYCETHTRQARDWYSHDPVTQWRSGDHVASAADVFGPPDRDDPSRPYQYNVKPMIAVSYAEAEELCAAISTDAIAYRLPTESEWEKAARGGLIGAPYPWGHEPPDGARCDHGHFGDWAIRPPRSYPPNGYGLFGMAGGVWEWTADDYDALAYLARVAPEQARAASPGDRPRERILRGGSWADCPEVCTVSYRMSRSGSSWRRGEWGAHEAPNIGFRLCRAER